MKNLCDVDIIGLCRDQSWYIPGFYPFVFPGNVRSGPDGTPEVLVECTAGKQSKKMLQVFLSVEGETKLPKSIILLHPDGSRSFLPENVLQPVHIFPHRVEQDCFLVSAPPNFSNAAPNISNVPQNTLNGLQEEFRFLPGCDGLGK